MRIEIDDNAFWATIWLIVAVSVVLIVTITTHMCSETTRLAIKSGLVEKQGYGSAQVLWSKP